jgi:signal transduction histidine kinase
MTRAAVDSCATVDDPQRAYTQALRHHLDHPGESSLRAGYEIGRRAVTRQMSLLELVMVHQAALASAWPVDATERGASAARAATAFLAETLSPFEMAYRGFFEANAALRQLNGTLEAEARRTARALHDGAGQLLFAFQLALADVRRDAPPAVIDRLNEIFELANELDLQLRSLARELHPVALDDLGLFEAVKLLAARIERTSGLAVVTTLPAETRRLAADIERCLYRALQESLTNVLKHAAARCVVIRLEIGETEIVCTVCDDGVGVSNREHGSGLGLVGIRDRLAALGGTLEIKSQPQRGTEVIMRLPHDDRKESRCPSPC